MRLARCEVLAALERGRSEGLPAGGGLQLVTLWLTDGGPVVDRHGSELHRPDVEALLRPAEARRLAFELLALAEHADRLTAGLSR